MIVAKPRPPQVDPLDILRPPPLPSSVLRDIKPKPRPKSKTTANRDHRIKKEPLFLSYIDDEAIGSSADESDGSMNEDDKAFIDDGDIDLISRRKGSRPRPRIGKRAPIPTKRIIKKEESNKLESSSDEMDGIESIPDEIADVKAQNEDKDGIKSEDDSMSGIESLDDVESVSAQLDELPRNEVAGGRPRRALVQTTVQTHTRVHNPQPSPDSDSDSDSDSNQDVVMLEDGGADQSQSHAYKIRRDHLEPQPVHRQEDVHMGDGRPDEEEESDDEDDLDIMKYVRHPAPNVNNQAAAQASKRSEREYSPLPATPFDYVCGEEPDFEDDHDCESL
jgi:hypothetical protein